MKKTGRRRRGITLIEIIVVMVLIGIIGGIVAYNVTGSLEKGKIFKTEQGILKIQNALELHLATRPQDFDNIQSNWEEYIKESPIIRDHDNLIRDGWGRKYRVVRKGSTFEVKSDSTPYIRYLEKQGRDQ